MRRISYLFTLLLLIVGAVSAYAQTPTADPITVEEVPDGYYFIASTQSTIDNVANPYIAANGGTMKLVAQSAVTTDASTSQVGLWYIRKTGTDGSDNHSTFSIQSMEGSKYYWGVGGNCPLQTTIGIYRIGKDDSGYYFYGNGTTGNITSTDYVNATSATVFGRNSSGANNKWKLIPAGVKDITLNYTVGTNHFSVSKLVGTGKAISTSLDFYKDFEPATITPDDATSSYSVTCAYNFPFEFGKYYKMKIRWADKNDNKNEKSSDGVYIYRSVVWNGQVKGEISTRDVVTETNNALWSFQIVEGTANQVYLSNALGGQKVTIDNATTNNLKAYMGPVGTPFYVKKGNTGTNYTNGFRLQSLTNENANLNDISGGLGYWTDGGSREDAGSTFTIIGEAASCVDQEINTVVATNTANNEVITMNNLSITEKLTGKTGDKWLCNTFFTTNNGSYDSSTKTFTVSYTPTASAPYQLSSLEDNGVKHWQVIRTRNDANDIKNCYLKLNGENIQSRNNVIDRTSLSSIRAFTETNENYWAIVPAGNFNQFYLVNKADQTKKAYLANENQGTAVTMSATNATGFYLNAQPTFSGITGGFTIQPNNSNNHAIGDHGNSNLCYWSNRWGDTELNDAGSIFYLVDLLADCKSVASATSNYVGGFSAQSISTLNATTACDGFFTKYDELLASTGNDVYTTPEENALYRITFNRCNAVAATNAVADAEGNVQNGSGNTPQERLLALVRNTVNTPSALVRFHQNGDNYTIEDVNSGYYYGFYYNDDRMFLVPATNQKGQFTIVNNFNGILSYVGLKETSVSDDTKRFLWSCGSYESEVFDNHPYVRFHSGINANNTAEAEAGCVLRIQKVTTYPVSISAAGYASLCLPFSVTLPQSGLTAYKVTDINRDNNNEMNLESVGSTIPAGEPVILQGAEDNYTLTINADNGTKATNNILTGATVKRTGISEEYYALAKKTIDETETVAFFRVSTTNMPANKAYLLKKNIPASALNAAMFMFNFDGNGGEVTDINTATKTETESNVYYDLNGRRVLYPSHGIYVKGNGQKVFIK